MNTNNNLRCLLICLGFQQSDTVQDVLNLHIDNSNCNTAVNFSNDKIVYPKRSGRGQRYDKNLFG